MCSRVVIVGLFVLSSRVVSAQNGHGYVDSRPWLPREQIVNSPTGEELIAESALPENFDWRNVHGKSYVTTDVNQHIPQYCGSCWIHGTVAALNDRIKIQRGASFPDVMLSRQALVNCVPGQNSSEPNPGCNGGDSFQIHKYMHNHKIPDESCMPYEAENMECTPYNICRNCKVPKDGGDCFAVENFVGYRTSQYGIVSGELAIMKEIYARGPIACGAALNSAFIYNYSNIALQNEGVFVQDQKFNESEIDHVMEVTGWGVTPSGIKYWALRNSWGTYWGDLGWAKLRRGVNQNLIELGCDWATIDVTDLDHSLDGRTVGDYVRGVQPIPAILDHNGARVTANVETATLTASEKMAPRGIGVLVPAAAAFLGAIAIFGLLHLAKLTRPLQQPPLLG